MTTALLPHDIGCEPSPSVPAETLIQDGWSTYLLFWAVSKQPEGSPPRLRDLGVAVVECEGCSLTKFGYPNDEGLPEHPAYPLGLEQATTSILEITDSAWAKELKDQANASRDRIWGERRAGSAEQPPLRHFVVVLKEATFECLAHSLVVRRFEPTFPAAVEYVHSKLAEH
jgi:hypothetical protein